MKISRVKAINFKGIKNIDVLLKKNVNKITGANGAGKSSFKDSIMATLCGAKYTPDVPVRIGQGKAEVTVETDDFIANGIYTKSGRRIEISSRDGLPIRKPQEFLDKCIGPLTFDPVAFYLAKPPEQVPMLKELVQVDFNDLNARQADIKQKRSDAKREKERLMHEAGRIQLADDVPDEEVSVAKLTTELQRANNFNINVADNRREVCRLEAERNDIQANAKEAEEKIKTLQSQIVGANNDLKLVNEALGSILLKENEEQDITEITKKISNVEEINVAVRENQRMGRLMDAADEQSSLFSELGQQAKALDAERADRLAKCQMPVKGLSLTDEYVTFGELPLKQVNTGEQLKICVSIALAMNPKLKTVFVKANDLDEENLALLEQMIIDKDYQALIELADTSSKIGIIIEDGRIKKKE